MTFPCRICNVPGRVTDRLHEPCPACQRDIASWYPPRPVHGTAEENTMDPYDQVQDHRAELAHDGEYLTTAQVVRMTLAFEADRGQYFRKLSPLGRHPFGLPRLTPVAASSGDAPVGLRSVSPPPAGAQADGHHLPHAA